MATLIADVKWKSYLKHGKKKKCEGEKKHCDGKVSNKKLVGMVEV